MTMASRWRPWAVLLLAAVVAAVAVWILAAGLPAWRLQDMSAYRLGADRLATGQPLYPPPADLLDTSDVYRYAPWFALLWLPLQGIPEPAVAVGWSAILIAASVLAVVPLLRTPTPTATPMRVALAALGFALALRGAAIGNVDPLMVAMLVHGVDRRAGPLAIAAAASLKVAPLALVLVYAGRREWTKVAWTLLLTVALVAPMLLYDLSDYPTAAGASISVLSLAGLPAWLAVVAAGAVVTFLLARTRWAWTAAAATVLLSYPRMGIYNLPILLVGVNDRRSNARSTITAAGAK